MKITTKKLFVISRKVKIGIFHHFFLSLSQHLPVRELSQLVLQHRQVLFSAAHPDSRPFGALAHVQILVGQQRHVEVVENGQAHGDQHLESAAPEQLIVDRLEGRQMAAKIELVEARHELMVVDGDELVAVQLTVLGRHKVVECVDEVDCGRCKAAELEVNLKKSNKISSKLFL
jgi:hypothetical protein